MADKKDRNSLEQLFQAGDIPTEEHFAQLIASGINQEDDGLRKSSDTPLEIQAPIEDPPAPNNISDLIRFYKESGQPEPSWKMRLRNDGLELNRGNQPDFLIDNTGRIGMGMIPDNRYSLNIRTTPGDRQHGLLIDGGPEANKDSFLLDLFAANNTGNNVKLRIGGDGRFSGSSETPDWGFHFQNSVNKGRILAAHGNGNPLYVEGGNNTNDASNLFTVARRINDKPDIKFNVKGNGDLEVSGAIRLVNKGPINAPEADTIYTNSLPVAYGEITNQGFLQNNNAFGIEREGTRQFSDGGRTPSYYNVKLKNPINANPAVLITQKDNGPNPSAIAFNYHVDLATNSIRVFITRQGKPVGVYFSIIVFGRK